MRGHFDWTVIARTNSHWFYESYNVDLINICWIFIGNIAVKPTNSNNALPDAASCSLTQQGSTDIIKSGSNCLYWTRLFAAGPFKQKCCRISRELPMLSRNYSRSNIYMSCNLIFNTDKRHINMTAVYLTVRTAYSGLGKEMFIIFYLNLNYFSQSNE